MRPAVVESGRTTTCESQEISTRTTAICNECTFQTVKSLCRRYVSCVPLHRPARIRIVAKLQAVFSSGSLCGAHRVVNPTWRTTVNRGKVGRRESFKSVSFEK